tara:strand:- start:217 stop:585 length:369 start_codon:yes stop_codon:yes gene_type:complete
MDKNDLTLYKEENKIKSGGYSVESFLLNNNKSATTTLNTPQNGGTKVSDLYKNIAVPSGLFFLKEKQTKKQIPIVPLDDNILPETIHDKLLELLSSTEQINHNIKTKRMRSRKHNKTKKNKN